jgi:hypothetical protein
MTTTKTLTAKEVEARSEHRLYSDCGHNYLADHAESQLSGRSHYYDADTRRYFGARVNHLTVERNGLLLCTVESVSPPSGSRAHRAVVFDLSGTLIYRSCHDEKGVYGFTTGKRAQADLTRWLDAYHDEATEAARVLEQETKAARRTLDRLTQ